MLILVAWQDCNVYTSWLWIDSWDGHILTDLGYHDMIEVGTISFDPFHFQFVGNDSAIMIIL